MAHRTPRPDKRLLGTWQSDRRRTLREWRFVGRVTPKKRRKVAAIFGKLRLRYTRTRIRGVLRDYRFTQRYRLLAADSDTVAIRYYDDNEFMSQWRIRHIHFVGRDHYWIALGRNREWFKRVKARAG